MIPIDGQQIESGAHAPGSPPIEQRIARCGQQIGAQREFRHPLVEGNRAASGNEAVAHSLRALAEGTEPSHVTGGSRLKQEHVHLMADDAYSDPGLVGSSQRMAGRPAQLPEAMLRIDPKRQVEVAAFMPDFDALASKLAEPRYFLSQRLGDRANDGDRLNFREFIHASVNTSAAMRKWR